MKDKVLGLIKQYYNPNACAIVTGVPMTDENMAIIDAMPKVLGIPIRRRWRGKGWKWGYHTKDGAERVSVYPKDGSYSIHLRLSSKGAPVVTVSHSGRIYPDNFYSDWTNIPTYESPTPKKKIDLDIVSVTC